MNTKSEEIKKYIPLTIIFLLIILSFFIIKSFILPLITAFILSYLIKPVYNKLNKNFSKSISAIISILIVFILIFIPFTGMITGTIQQASSLIKSETFLNSIKDISNTNLFKSLQIDLSSLIDKTLSISVSLLTDIINYLATAIIGILIIILGMYYILHDWDKLTENIVRYYPSKNKNKISKEMSKITNSIVYGTFLIALIEFTIAALGFWIFGVKPFLLLALFIAALAFLPGLGSTIIWIPVSIIFLIQQSYISAVGVIITGLFISIYIDTILRAKISGKSSGIHPLVILVGILGGVSLLGVAGFVIGPLIITYTLKLLEEIIEE
jgi:predicted PurR-regulated permease PerM